MKIALNILPLQSAHQTRGIGSYTKNLLQNLKKISGIEVQEFINLTEVRKVDIVHFPWYDLFFNTLPFRKKFNTVVTIHDVMPLVFSQNYPVGFKGKLNFYLQRLSLNNVHIITDSMNSKKDIIKYLKIPESKISVVPLAASRDFKVLSDGAKLRIKRKFNLPDNFLLYTGDANFVKNIPFLIEGFNKLVSDEQFQNIKLVLVGGVFLKKVEDIEHPELASLKKVNQLIDEYFLAGSIIRPGQLELDDLVGFYNLATAYIQPSLYEGFGLPVLEAMACGCPVISSNAASLPEVGGNAALYFSPHNLDQFVKVLAEVLKDSSVRKKLTKLGLEHAEKYSWERVTDETIKVYSKVLEF